jgi:hypothetical protein
MLPSSCDVLASSLARVKSPYLLAPAAHHSSCSHSTPRDSSPCWHCQFFGDVIDGVAWECGLSVYVLGAPRGIVYKSKDLTCHDAAVCVLKSWLIVVTPANRGPRSCHATAIS